MRGVRVATDVSRSSGRTAAPVLVASTAWGLPDKQPHFPSVLRSKPSSYGVSSVGIHLGSPGRVESEIHSEEEAPSS